jgi:hypothetical protein
MHYYAIDDYGMVLNGNHLECLIAKYYEDYDPNTYDNTRYEFYESLCEEGIVDCIPSFIGEAVPLNDNGEDDWGRRDFYNDDAVYYIQLNNYPNVLHAAYNNIEEIVEELRGKVGSLLPDNFDYRACVKHITGVYYG